MWCFLLRDYVSRELTMLKGAGSSSSIQQQHRWFNTQSQKFLNNGIVIFVGLRELLLRVAQMVTMMMMDSKECLMVWRKRRIGQGY